MEGSRTSNTVKNIVFGWTNRIVLLILPFISRTVILYTLGAEYLGLGSLFTSILHMLNMTELGFSSAIVFSLYKPLAEKDDEAVRGLMSLYKKIYTVLGFVILGIGICILPFLPYLIKGEVSVDVNIYIIYLIYLLNTSISYIAFAYKSSLLQADQKMRTATNVQSVVVCLQNILQIVVLLLIENYYVYIILLPICTLIYNLVLSRIVDKTYPQYIKKGKSKQPEKKALMKQVQGLAVSKICATMRDGMDSITISAFVGITQVAIYSNYHYVISALRGIMTVITGGMRASVGNSLVLESKEKNLNDMLKFNSFYLLLGGWCSICMICVFQDFMKIWAGGELLFNNSVMILFVAYFYTLCMSDVRNVYIEAKGLWYEFRARAVIECVANLVLNISLVILLGVSGVVIATLITFTVVNLGYGTTVLFKHYFGKDKLKDYILQNVKLTIINVVVLVPVYLGSIFIPGDSWLMLFVKAIVCGAVGGVLLVLLYLPDKHFKQLANSFLPFFKKFVKR